MLYVALRYDLVRTPNSNAHLITAPVKPYRQGLSSAYRGGSEASESDEEDAAASLAQEIEAVRLRIDAIFAHGFITTLRMSVPPPLAFALAAPPSLRRLRVDTAALSPVRPLSTSDVASWALGGSVLEVTFDGRGQLRAHVFAVMRALRDGARVERVTIVVGSDVAPWRSWTNVVPVLPAGCVRLELRCCGEPLGDPPSDAQLQNGQLRTDRLAAAVRPDGDR